MSKSNLFKIYANQTFQMINFATIKSTKYYSKLKHILYVTHKSTIISGIWILGTNQYSCL